MFFINFSATINWVGKMISSTQPYNEIQSICSSKLPNNKK